MSPDLIKWYLQRVRQRDLYTGSLRIPWVVAWLKDSGLISYKRSNVNGVSDWTLTEKGETLLKMLEL